MDQILSYWGKADKEDAASWHPAAFHCLDVAACARTLMRVQPNTNEQIAYTLKVSADAARDLAVLLIALHDIGKFSSAFQSLRRDLASGASTHMPAASSIRHDAITWLLWEDAASSDDGVVAALSRWCSDPYDLDPLMKAVAGHHGEPVDHAGTRPPLSDLMSPSDLSAAADFIQACTRLLPETTTPGQITEASAKRASWLLAGLCTLADWLGSNTEWFPFVDPSEVSGLEDYWYTHALPKASIAINAAGLVPASAAKQYGLGAIFPNLAGVAPTPLQAFAESVEITQGPQLFVLEDHAGAGKTEAALLLAHRMNAAGLASGYYFGLPTMATSNAMYTRVADSVETLFQAPEKSSTVLAQSSRTLNARFMESIRQAEPARYDTTQTGGAACAAWLADNRKKSLLAQVGVGTIDQALMAVLPRSHQSLRSLGLAQKILIVDEVHAYDAYMTTLLCRLLEFQAAFGASVILLSATLPQVLRQRLVAAYARGRGSSTPTVREAAFPLATQLSDRGVKEHPIASSGRGDRRIAVRLVSTVEAARDHVLSQARRGRAVCWIRNTVQEAQAAYKELLEAGADIQKTDLFHARMILGDRLAVENRVLASFGKDGTAADRHGRILVATQVVEQSLDIDFDDLITDLCPIDLLIQRAGRLHRHARRMDGTPAPNGRDERPAPVLQVLAHPASPSDRSDWHEDISSGTTAVYPDKSALWLTVRSLADGWLDVRSGSDGGGARRHMESVYADGIAAGAPAEIRDAAQDAIVKASAHAALGSQTAINLNAGYATTDGAWGRGQDAPTRLGEPTTDIYLVRIDNDGKPGPFWAGPGGWSMSRLSLRTELLDRSYFETPAIEAIVNDLANANPELFRYARILPMRRKPDGSWMSDLITPRIRFSYSAALGLTVERGAI